MLNVIAISLGASLGALLRWQLGLWLNAGHTGAVALPWGTLAANWLGAYAIGVAVVVLQHQTHLDPAWRLALVTGFLGALTTFSTFSAEAVTLLQQGRVLLALGHSGLHLLGSLFLTWAGLLSANFLVAKNTLQ